MTVEQKIVKYRKMIEQLEKEIQEPDMEPRYRRYAQRDIDLFNNEIKRLEE